MRLPAGAVRELHWHVPAEWAFVTYGSGRITAVDLETRKNLSLTSRKAIFGSSRRRAAFNPGPRPNGCEFILVFNDGNFSEDRTFLITDWFNHTPKDLAKNFGVPASTFDNTPKKGFFDFQCAGSG